MRSRTKSSTVSSRSPEAPAWFCSKSVAMKLHLSTHLSAVALLRQQFVFKLSAGCRRWSSCVCGAAGSGSHGACCRTRSSGSAIFSRVAKLGLGVEASSNLEPNTATVDVLQACLLPPLCPAFYYYHQVQALHAPVYIMYYMHPSTDAITIYYYH